MEEVQNKKKKKPEFKSNEYSFWRYLVFLIVAFGLGQVIGGVLATVILWVMPIFAEGGQLSNMYQSVLIILAFAINFIFAMLMIKPILRTTFKSLVTGNRKYKIGYAFVCVLIYIIVSVVVMLICRKNIYYNPAELKLRLVCLIIAILFIPLQTTTEELVFRMSLGRLFMKNEVMKSVPKMLLVSLISGLLFLVPHLSNPEVGAYGMVTAVFSYFGVGFALMLISCITGSFEGALAVHAINNIWVMSVCTTEVAAANFAPMFIDTTDDPLTMCLTVAVLYALLIVWSIIYRNKHKLANE